MIHLVYQPEVIVRKYWTPEEDLLLRSGVADAEIGDWKTVALYVPGRNNRQCAARY
jgi:hypothetical protein